MVKLDIALLTLAGWLFAWLLSEISVDVINIGMFALAGWVFVRLLLEIVSLVVAISEQFVAVLPFLVRRAFIAIATMFRRGAGSARKVPPWDGGNSD